MKDLLASGPHLAVIPTLTALAVRHFKHKQGQDDGGAELAPKHPAVKFVLGAWNDGDFSDADSHIAPGIEIYTNGLSFSAEHDGPAIARQSIESWRALAPDLRMELSQEIREKHRIAIGVPDHRNPHRGHLRAAGQRRGDRRRGHRVPDAQRWQGHRGLDGLRRARARGPDGGRRGARLVAGAQLNPRPVVQRGAAPAVRQVQGRGQPFHLVAGFVSRPPSACLT